MQSLDRAWILPEPELPDAGALLAEGRKLAESVQVGPCPFLSEWGVRSEGEYKRRRMVEGAIMLHAQVGWRSPEKTRHGLAEIHRRIAAAGYRVDRCGICLDWSMGYPAARRAHMPQGTGLILERPEDFVALTHSAPIAFHFGDFVIGTPAAVENTAAALRAGSTAIGNLGQYFTFRMPRWSDDVGTTAETVKALALCAAQPVEVLVHSNLDDGFAALFCDLACGIGAVLLERYILEDLIGARMSHCYGHTFSEPLTRLAFQRALARTSPHPGSMVYGNTTSFVASEVENYANLGGYLLTDILAQRTLPAGHGLNPVPVTEAMRIPEVGEIVDAHLFANRLVQWAEGYRPLLDLSRADVLADRMVEGGRTFKERALKGLAEAGIDIRNPFELLLAIRRIGARRMEEQFGPGLPQADALRKRIPVVRATTVAALEAQGQGLAAALAPEDRAALRAGGLKACVTCTDVHEYGKILVETVLETLGVAVEDAGVSAEPEDVARHAHERGADFIAVSTYNGVALGFLQALRREMARLGLDLPIFIGGKLNQVPEDSADSLPVDISGELAALGARVCLRVEDMLAELAAMARGRAVQAGRS
ncbi:MAG: cobalamin-dependent protein [Holophaga sp.]|jgi:methylmalonyl-CoA mutase cobalamin-binding domain/chain